MKKGLYAILAVLTVFAMVMVSCGDSGGGGGGDTTYTVTFNSNGGSSVAPIKGLKSGATITEPTAPTKDPEEEGNSIDFLGWFKENITYEAWFNEVDVSAKKWNFAADKVTSNITLYALWSPEYGEGVEIEITYAANGSAGTAPEVQTATAGGDVTLADKGELTKASTATITYVFEGWNTKADGSGKLFGAGEETKLYANVTLYATWAEGGTIVYDKNGAAVTGTAPEAVVAKNGTVIEVADKGTLAKPDFGFAGWAASAAAESPAYKAGDDYTVNGNATLYAVWLPIRTITYDKNNASATGTVPPAEKGIDGETFEVAGGEALTLANFVVAGWSTTATGDVEYEEGDVYTINGDATLYAIWLREYTITYDVNGGTGKAPEPVKVTAGKTIAIANGSALTLDGYIFDGWNTKDDGTGTNYPYNAVYTPTGNDSAITLYVNWAEAWTVTFDMNSAIGDAPQPIVVKKTASIVIPAFPNKYLTFTGWNTKADMTDESGTNYAAAVTYIPTADITLYAWWTDPDVAAADEVIEQLSLANAWNAVYKFDTSLTWDKFKDLHATYRLDEDTFNNGAPRAVRVMGQFTAEEIDNPKFGTNTAGVNIAIVGDWPGGTSNDWIFSQIASSWTGGDFPSALANYTVPSGTDIEAGKWFTIGYPVDTPVAPNGSFNKTGVRLPKATDTGPFYFAVGLPGNDPNTFRVKNVTLKGVLPADDVLGEPLYYDIDGTRYRAINGQKDQNGWQQLRWSIVDGETNVKEVPLKEDDITAAEVTITFDVNEPAAATGSTPAAPTAIKANKGVTLNRSQLSPSLALKGYKLKNWSSTDDGTGAGVINVPASGTNDSFMMNFIDDTTFYAIWDINNLPDATEDVVVPVTGDGAIAISSFGGLGDLNSNAGAGPFNFLASYGYDAAIWFALPAATNTAVYEKIEITYSVERLTSGTPANPMKLAFQQDRPVNTWSGGTAEYEDHTANGTYTKTLLVDDCFQGIMIQDNGRTASADFKFTIIGIKLLKPAP